MLSDDNNLSRLMVTWFDQIDSRGGKMDGKGRLAETAQLVTHDVVEPHRFAVGIVHCDVEAACFDSQF